MTRKRGKLSLDEMKYIRENCFDLSIEEIADNLNRTEEPVRRYIDEQNLKARDLDDHSHLLNEMRSRYYYGELKKQMNDAELIYAEHQWIDYFRQFNEDVTHTEEMQILETIRTEVLINRGMEDRQDNMRRIEKLERLISEEMEKPKDFQDTQALAVFHTQLGAAIASKSAYINEHDKLLTKKERLLKDLKGTREQRKRNAEDAKTNFSMWLKQLPEFMEDDGYEMEVQAIAANKAFERLGDYHSYEDGNLDQPILNSDTIKEEENE